MIHSYGGPVMRSSVLLPGRPSAFLLMLAFLLPVTAFAQTGRIAGRVTDAQSGQPIPGVNVVIEGTTVGTATDVDGYYSIINVAPGVYSLRATFIGYTPLVVEGVEVNIDLTTTVDFELQEEAIGLEEVVVTSTPPIIQRDIAGSERNISAEEIQNAPYQNINQVITSQVSINSVGRFNDRPEIRGSSIEESKFIVDGIDQSDPLTNRPYTRINLDAVQEVKMQTGGFSAEYGNLRSGVVNVVTREGGDRYSGSFNIQYSPPGLKHFGPMPYGHASAVTKPFVEPWQAFSSTNEFAEEGFAGWLAEAASPSRDPQHTGSAAELYALWLWRHRSQDSIDMLKELSRNGGNIRAAWEAVHGSLPAGATIPDGIGTVDVEFAPGIDPDEQTFHQTGDMPDYNISATFGGPVPFLNPVKFFLAYDRQQIEYAAEFPQPAYVDNSLRGKVTTRIGNTKINLNGFWSRQKGGDGGQGPGIDGWISTNPYRQLGGSNKFWYSHCAVPGQQTRQIYAAQLTHTFNANTFAQLDVSHHRTDYKMLNDVRETKPLAAVPGQTSALQGLLNPDGESFDEIKDWARIRIGDYWYDEAPVGYSPVWWVDVTGYYRMSSCNVRYNNTYSRKWEAKGSVTSQVNRNNQVKAGFTVQNVTLHQYYYALDPSVNGGSLDQADARPWMVGLYAQDKIEYQGFVANIGLRLDGILHDAFPLLDGTGDAGPYSTYLLQGNTIRTDYDPNSPDYDPEKPTEIRLSDQLAREKTSQWRLSPRIGISHPISTVAKLFFNYGHMYQWADLFSYYRINYNTRQGNRVSSMGNPLLGPARTIAYEVGYEQNLFDRMNLRLTGYYKDINDEADWASYVPLGESSYSRRTNQRFRDVRGVEAFLELRRGVVTLPYGMDLSGWGSVNYLVESGGEFGYDQFFEDPTRQPRQVSTEVSDPDVRPLVKLNVSLSTPEELGPGGNGFSLLGGLDVSLMYEWQRGFQFTWNPENYPLVENNVRWAPYKRWDLRLTKSLFTQGRFDAMFYLDITNLFNQKYLHPPANTDISNTADSFAWDGQKWFNNQFVNYMESLDLKVNEDGSVEGSQRPGDYKGDNIDLPDWDSWSFLDKRDIYFGIRLYF
ncbi:MAG: hypothetical protein D6685_06260 [Bacteroidetes bacterium]|nr:MAG: hypothetical protein D6685_06260 [Bacteroidota bacterium]